MPPEIRSVSAGEVPALLPALTVLLRDAVDGGASLGFLPPLNVDEAGAYWHGVLAEVRGGTRLLFVAREGGRLLGSVQLALATKANAKHRAEVEKLAVLTAERSRGLGTALMEAAHAAALARGRTLLILDTRRGDPAEALYRHLGYTEFGIVPGFTRDARGVSYDTVFFHKHLGG